MKRCCPGCCVYTKKVGEVGPVFDYDQYDISRLLEGPLYTDQDRIIILWTFEHLSIQVLWKKTNYS